MDTVISMIGSGTAHPCNRPRPESYLSRFVYDLVKGREDIISKLNLCNRTHALQCSAYGEADNALLAEWRIEHPLRSKFSRQIHGAAEYTAESDIFAKEQCAGI
jgi:hypothetical protein